MLLLTGASALAQTNFEEEFDDPNKPWQEIEIQLPAPPKDADLLSFYVSPTATQNYAIDPKSLTVGTDGVVRYTMVAVSQGGARNVSYEGIRCVSFEKKLYALGQPDGKWTRSRRDQWEPIVRGNANRQHAALALDYFCQGRSIAGKGEEMIKRIRSKRTLPDENLR